VTSGSDIEGGDVAEVRRAGSSSVIRGLDSFLKVGAGDDANPTVGGSPHMPQNPQRSVRALGSV